MGRLRQDLRYAARHLLRSPGYAAVAVVTLAVGIGADNGVSPADPRVRAAAPE